MGGYKYLYFERECDLRKFWYFFCKPTFIILKYILYKCLGPLIQFYQKTTDDE